MKRCKIRVEHSIYPPCKLQIRPGTTCLDVLSYLGLTGDYVLLPLSNPTKTFTPEEVLYDLIKNDDKLIATLSPEATASINKVRATLCAMRTNTYESSRTQSARE